MHKIQIWMNTLAFYRCCYANFGNWQKRILINFMSDAWRHCIRILTNDIFWLKSNTNNLKSFIWENNIWHSKAIPAKSFSFLNFSNNNIIKADRVRILENEILQRDFKWSQCNKTFFIRLDSRSFIFWLFTIISRALQF